MYFKANSQQAPVQNQAGPSWVKLGQAELCIHLCQWTNNEKIGKKKKEQKLSGENTPKSEMENVLFKMGKVSRAKWSYEFTEGFRRINKVDSQILMHTSIVMVLPEPE